MTAATTSLGLIPLLLATGPGSEAQRPLAVAVVGGLVTSTGFPGMTVTQAKGHGREKLEDEHDRGAELTDFTPTVRLEVIVGDLVEPVFTTIYEAAHTGARGDGKVYVLPVLDALRMESGARGEEAV